MTGRELIEFIQKNHLEDCTVEVCHGTGGRSYPIRDIGMLQDWIPVTERLPEDGLAVLVTADKSGNRITSQDVYSKSTGWCIWNESVIAWMPRPEPYNGS